MIQSFFNLKKWVESHKITTFVAILSLTIIVTRLAVWIHNPATTIFNFEIHHFDYGILLLLITNLIYLFGNAKSKINFYINAVAFGLIIDDIWFIRSNINDPTKNELQIYDSTLPSVAIIWILLIIFILLIHKKGN